MKSLVIWRNPKTNKYYYRYISNIVPRYEVGDRNSYGHVVILVIDVYKELLYKKPLKKKVLSLFIGFLQNIYKRL